MSYMFLSKDAAATALLYAAANDNTEMVRLLLDKGANASAINKVSHDASIYLFSGEGLHRCLL